jgi:sporulation protein YlmC with PRC-barrel domain
MLARYLAAGVTGAMLLAGAAFAAESTATDTSGKWRASKVVGLKIYNDQNEHVGSINDLLMDKDGRIKVAVISVGGLLGVGSRLVALPYEKIKFSTEPITYTGASNMGGGTKPPSSSSSTTGSSTTTGSAATKPAATPSKPNPWYPDHAVFNASKDELKNMPEFKYSE